MQQVFECSENRHSILVSKKFIRAIDYSLSTKRECTTNGSWEKGNEVVMEKKKKSEWSVFRVQGTKERVALRNGKPFPEFITRMAAERPSGELPRSACSSSSSGYHGQLLICLLMSLAQLFVESAGMRWLASPTGCENNNGSRFYSNSFTLKKPHKALYSKALGP